MILYQYILAVLFGLLIGSFLNVCIYRWPRDLSVVRPRSHCTSCEKTIAWYDNIPLVSYLLLGGKCRACQARIPLRYPAVELLTAVLFALCLRVWGPTWEGLRAAIFCAMQIGLVFSDLEERILPDEFTKGGALIGFAFSFVAPVHDHVAQMIGWMVGLKLPEEYHSPFESVLGALLPAGVLWLAGWLYEKLRHKEGLGFGDVKLTMMIGANLGFLSALGTLLLGAFVGSVLGLLFITITKKDSATYELPFGTFLGVTAVIALFGGAKLLTFLPF